MNYRTTLEIIENLLQKKNVCEWVFTACQEMLFFAAFFSIEIKLTSTIIICKVSNCKKNKILIHYLSSLILRFRLRLRLRFSFCIGLCFYCLTFVYKSHCTSTFNSALIMFVCLFICHSILYDILISTIKLQTAKRIDGSNSKINIYLHFLKKKQRYLICNFSTNLHNGHSVKDNKVEMN